MAYYHRNKNIFKKSSEEFRKNFFEFLEIKGTQKK